MWWCKRVRRWENKNDTSEHCLPPPIDLPISDHHSIWQTKEGPRWFMFWRWEGARGHPVSHSEHTSVTQLPICLLRCPLCLGNSCDTRVVTPLSVDYISLNISFPPALASVRLCTRPYSKGKQFLSFWGRAGWMSIGTIDRCVGITRKTT